MKKKLLIAVCISAGFTAKSQLTYVGDGALVHIEDQALVYSGGGVKLDGTSKVNTIGDIMMVTATENLEVASTSDFRLKYVSPSVFGQLYIQDTPQGNITGKVNKEYVSALHGSSGWQQTGLPFYNYSVTDLQATLPFVNVSNTALNNWGRWNPRSVYKWNNALAVWDQLDASMTTAVGKPTDYYILSVRSAEGMMWDPALTAENELGATDNLAGTSTTAVPLTLNTKRKIFQGKPVSDVNGDTQVTLAGAFGNFGTNGASTNKYRERYNSYIDDPFVTQLWGVDYGKNTYQYGNPFLTNVDLSLVKKGDAVTDDENAISNLNGIYYYTTVAGSNKGVAFTSLAGVRITFDTSGNPVGDVDQLVIKPMQEFVVKLTDATSQTLKFNKTRRFAQTARTESVPYSVTAARMTAPSMVTKQLGVVLLDADDNEIGRTYYVVNSEAVSGYAPAAARMQALSDLNNIFTQEELPAGGKDHNTSYGLYINEANETAFQGKALPLVVNNSSAAKLKFLISENGKPLSDNTNLSNGKSFYFGNNGSLTQLKSGTVVPLTSTNASFSLYYEQPAGTTLTTTELINGQTIIAKSGSDYVVRFNKNWKNADIEVYSSAGQLVYSAKKVPTNTDFTLPLNSSVNTVYLVKIKSENGEVITKKVIK